VNDGRVSSVADICDEALRESCRPLMVSAVAQDSTGALPSQIPCNYEAEPQVQQSLVAMQTLLIQRGRHCIAFGSRAEQL
jgi:hypothetical protein